MSHLYLAQASISVSSDAEDRQLIRSRVARLQNTEGEVTRTNGNRPASPSQLLKEIETLSWLPFSQRSLLHHFVHEACGGLTTSNISGEMKICQMMVPRALKNPALLKSVLALAAVHKKTLVSSASERESLGKTIRTLIQSSIQAFQIELHDLDRRQKTISSAVALCLCMQTIYGEDSDPRSWRAHMDGAKAIIGSIQGEGVQEEELELLDFVTRWYRAIESLAALTSIGLPSGQLDDASPNENSYMDEYCGYNIKLNPVLVAIGAAAWERRHTAVANIPNLMSEAHWELKATWLEQTVRNLMEQSLESEPYFFPGVAEQLSPAEIKAFMLCNEAYYFMALIHIYCRVRGDSPHSENVQELVRQLLNRASSIIPSSKLSPYLALTSPVFTAGCVAFGEMRNLVRKLLSRSHHTAPYRSTFLAVQFLEAFWKENEADYFEDWATFQERNNIDFIPF